MSSEDEQTLQQACSELGIQCIRGNGIKDLIDKNVSAILSASSEWRVNGAYPDIHEAVSKGILEININGETEEVGAYNISTKSETITNQLKWMFEEMGGKGDFAYYNFGANEIIQHEIEMVLKEYPGINPIAVQTSYDNNTLTEQGIADLVAQNPNLGAVWSDQFLNNLFWGLKPVEEKGEKIPLIVCEPKKEMLEYWKERSTNNDSFKCIATIPHTGQYYESVYVAYFLLNGSKINPAAMGGVSGNTFKYDLQSITNDNLDDWLAKIDSMDTDKGGAVFTPALTPEEIKSKWFIE